MATQSLLHKHRTILEQVDPHLTTCLRQVTQSGEIDVACQRRGNTALASDRHW